MYKMYGYEVPKRHDYRILDISWEPFMHVGGLVSEYCSGMKKLNIFQEKFELQRKSRDFKKQLRFQEKVKISTKSRHITNKLSFQEKVRISKTNGDFKKHSRLQEKK